MLALQFLPERLVLGGGHAEQVGDDQESERLRVVADELAPPACDELVELAVGKSLWLWGAAIVFVLARIAHAFGMDRPGANILRVAGIALSWLVLLGLGAFAIYLAYTSPSLFESAR